MARLQIYKDNYIESTAVSNRFIDEYMKDANDAQLKIYLYLLRMMHANLSFSVSDIADKFNHTEKDVLRALRYWEKQRLLTLDYDEDKNLVGIHLCELGSGGTRTNQHSTMTLQPQESQEQPEPDPYAKPAYNADQLRSFKEQDNIAQLLFVAQVYVGRTLTASDMKTILYLSDVLHFSDDLIDYLIQYCVDRGKKDFRYMEKVAISWAQQGITTPKQAQKAARLFL